MQRRPICALALVSMIAFGGCGQSNQQPEAPHLAVDTDGRVWLHRPEGPPHLVDSAREAARYMAAYYGDLATEGRRVPIVVTKPSETEFGPLAELFHQCAQRNRSHLTINGIPVSLPQFRGVSAAAQDDVTTLPIVTIRIGSPTGLKRNTRVVAAMPFGKTWRDARTSAEFARELASARQQDAQLFRDGLLIRLEATTDASCETWIELYGAAVAAATPERIDLAVFEPAELNIPKAGAPSTNVRSACTVSESGRPTRVRVRKYSTSDSRINRQSSKPTQIVMIGVGTNSGTSVPIGEAYSGGPSTGFFGAGGNARRIVYVVDRSGSMFGTFDYIRAEMRRSISRLKPIQDFHVIFFASGEPQESRAKMLVPATGNYKKQAYTYLQGVVAEGRTTPAKALERAFAVTNKKGKHAQLIYLLTDGEFKPELVKQIERMQAKLKTKIKINTLGFIYRSGEKILKQIAEANGGVYQFVSRDDLGR